MTPFHKHVWMALGFATLCEIAFVITIILLIGCGTDTSSVPKPPRAEAVPFTPVHRDRQWDCYCTPLDPDEYPETDDGDGAPV